MRRTRNAAGVLFLLTALFAGRTVVRADPTMWWNDWHFVGCDGYGYPVYQRESAWQEEPISCLELLEGCQNFCGDPEHVAGFDCTGDQYSGGTSGYCNCQAQGAQYTDGC